MKIDVRGEICPYPMMKTSEALKKLEGDETLEVLTDHAPALGTIPWEAAKNGYETSIEGAADSEWRLTLRKSEKEPPSRKSSLPTCRSNSQR